MVTESGDLILIAAQRRGEALGPEPIVLDAGDTLLLQGTWKAFDEHLTDPDVLVVNSPEPVRRQGRTPGGWRETGNRDPNRHSPVARDRYRAAGHCRPSCGRRTHSHWSSDGRPILQGDFLDNRYPSRGNHAFVDRNAGNRCSDCSAPTFTQQRRFATLTRPAQGLVDFDLQQEVGPDCCFARASFMSSSN
jgi:hypothetical protein